MSRRSESVRLMPGMQTVPHNRKSSGKKTCVPAPGYRSYVPVLRLVLYLRDKHAWVRAVLSVSPAANGPLRTLEVVVMMPILAGNRSHTGQEQVV
jgi:hypothetical protein